MEGVFVFLSLLPSLLSFFSYNVHSETSSWRGMYGELEQSRRANLAAAGPPLLTFSVFASGDFGTKPVLLAVTERNVLLYLSLA